MFYDFLDCVEDLFCLFVDVDPHDVKDLVCDKIHKEEHISFAVSMDDENSLLSPQPINLSFISEKDNLEGWHLPVHWFRRPYLYLYLVDNSKEPGLFLL